MEIELEFDYRDYNPNFHHLEREMTNTDRRFIWLYGGSSSAKSYSCAQAILIIGCLIEGSNTVVFRKVSSTIDESIYNDFKTVIDNLGLNDFFECISKKIRCINGSKIVFKGLDDPEKIKGISSFKRVVIDEVSECDFSDFKQVRKRLRGQLGQQIICTFNPIDKEHWIKKKVFDEESRNKLSNSLIDPKGILELNVDEKYTYVSEKWEGDNIFVEGEEKPPNFVVIKSTYLNNFWVVGSPCESFGFVDVQTIADFDKDKKDDFEYYKIYALGEWGKINRGGEAYKSFSAQRNTFVRKYNKDLPIHLSFDENVNPYLTLSIYQAKGLEAWKIDEICLEHPLNTLDHSIAEFNNRYPDVNKLFIYGDRTSLKADSKLEKGQNFFSIIQSKLKKNGYPNDLRLPKRNPSVVLRINFMNDLFAGKIQGCSYFIDKSCVKTIDDYESVKEAPDGTKLKQKIKDKITKVTYEPYGHLSDTDDYFICEYFKVQYNKYINSNQRRKKRKPYAV